MKKMFAVLLLSGCLIACKDNNTKTSKNVLAAAANAPGLNAGIGNFSIHTPAGWIKKDTSLQGIKVLFLYPPATTASTFHPNLNVITEAMGGYEFDKYIDKNLEGMTGYIPSFAIVDRGDITANDIRGKWIHYTQVQNGVPVENVYYMFPKDGICYGITSTTLKGDMDKYRPAFESVIKTLQVQ